MARVCCEPGCPVITDESRCDAHRRANGRAKQTRRWRKRGNTIEQRTATHRAADGLCQGCAAPTPLAAGVREHVVALGDGGADSAANTIWLCVACADAKTAIARAQGLSG